MVVKRGLAQGPGNVVAEECIPGAGVAIPVLMTAGEAQQGRQKDMLPWTSADGTPYGYQQYHECAGK
jgi:hypothetical protein